ncbi:threonine-phosphate decarboxylase [Silicimonas algicola]|uniref:threonine-phosphate decarboxylase n=1 Tax=Silicimonas algicola TaxID=1826607 RepID=A0A316G9T1_9RHOB|nr:threonine-phosphate decarboxylase CobD [Silicimonas algicola]AZQ67293.1 threonine-phosphate decarboxylase [Silicimonas algicola]PWK56965.1 L-threonine O-3-phosphate decarboxylase [Silicimonas algicola]
MRDHGGNLDAAMARWGGGPDDWVDLSTGINPTPYPLPDIPARAWGALPTRADFDALSDAAQAAYGAAGAVLPVAGAQAAIQLLPRVLPRGRARVLGPTYNEHAASFAGAGWETETVASVEALEGADVAVVVNPNNPDGRRLSREALSALASKVGLLVVDESFADPEPELSMADEGTPNILILRSFGKFYGLAGLRLGFVLGSPDRIAALAEASGPWPVSGPAIAIGQAALADSTWRDETVVRLARDADRLDSLATGMGWTVEGGTTLFRLYRTTDARAAQERLAQARVWSRIFPYSTSWIRLGLPDGADWTQIEAALRA